MTTNLWKFCKFIFIIVFYFCYNTLFKYFLNFVGINLNNLNSEKNIIILIFSEFLLTLILYLIYHKDINNNINDLKEHFSEYFSFGLKWWIVGVLIMITSNVIINIYYPSQATNEVIIEQLIEKVPIYMFVSAVIFGPITEEIVFRKSLREIFTNDFIYILMSGLIFGYIHTLAGESIMELVYIIPYGTLGCIFAYLYTKTKNILVPITFHMIHNAIIVVFYIISLVL